MGNLWGLSFLIRDQTWAQGLNVASPNNWTAREFPVFFFSFLLDLMGYRVSKFLPKLTPKTINIFWD